MIREAISQLLDNQSLTAEQAEGVAVSQSARIDIRQVCSAALAPIVSSAPNRSPDCVMSLTKINVVRSKFVLDGRNIGARGGVHDRAIEWLSG